jgi:osmotically-inducible protein OsmY
MAYADRPLDTYAEKQAATRAVRRVAGVRAIAVEIDVKLSPEHRRSDTDIAASAELALKWNTSIPLDSVKVTVDHRLGDAARRGGVELPASRSRDGDPAADGGGRHQERTEARSKAKAADISRKIEDALRRQALGEAQRIHVAVDGTVMLTGSVRSWQERDAAQRSTPPFLRQLAFSFRKAPCLCTAVVLQGGVRSM